MFQKQISDEEISKLPLRAFAGQIDVIDHPSKVSEAVYYLQQQKVIGFDTETKPWFRKGKRNINRVALLQLSDDKRAFLFRINRIGLPNEVLKILSNPDIIKVGAAVREDIRNLQKVNYFESASFLELQSYVKFFGIENYGLKNIAAIVLKFRISKAQRLSNWENFVLTADQNLYAATDAWLGYEIYHTLKNADFKLFPLTNNVNSVKDQF
jgi:ribonuclease D